MREGSYLDRGRSTGHLLAAKLKPEGQQARQGLKDVMVAAHHGVPIILQHQRQDLKVGLIFPKRYPESTPKSWSCPKVAQSAGYGIKVFFGVSH